MKKLIGLLCILLMLTMLMPVKQAEARGGGGFLPGLIIGGVLGWGLTPQYYYPPPAYYYPPPAYYYPPPALLSTSGTSSTRGILYTRPRMNPPKRRSPVGQIFYLSPQKPEFTETGRGSPEMP